MSNDRKTPPGRPSSMRFAMLNLVETWLAEDSDVREIRLRVVTGRGLCVFVHKGPKVDDSVMGPQEELVNLMLRIISRLS